MNGFAQLAEILLSCLTAEDIAELEAEAAAAKPGIAKAPAADSGVRLAEKPRGRRKAS